MIIFAIANFQPLPQKPTTENIGRYVAYSENIIRSSEINTTSPNDFIQKLSNQAGTKIYTSEPTLEEFQVSSYTHTYIAICIQHFLHVLYVYIHNICDELFIWVAIY